MKLLRKLEENTEEWIAVILFSIMVILVFVQIIFRFVLNFSLDWTEEMARFTFISLVYISASIAVKNNKHLRTQAIFEFLPKKISKYLLLLSNVIWLTFTLFMVKFGYDTVVQILSSAQRSPVLHLKMGYVYMIIPVGFALISIRIIQYIIKDFGDKNEEVESPTNNM